MMRRLAAVVVALCTVAALGLSGKIVEFVDSSHVSRIQYPNGSVRWFVDEQGPRAQWFGRVTDYDRRGTVTFQPEEKSESGADERLNIDFNDRGNGKLAGSINYEHEADRDKLELMYRRYPNQSALETSLVRPAINGSVYLTGQLMSSYESYSTRKAELVQFVIDQTQRGTYLTRSTQVEVVDELDPTKKTTIMRSDIVRDAAAPGGLARQAGSAALGDFGLRAYGFAIEGLTYDKTVNDQIAKQQEITMAVQTARAQTLQAQQAEITAAAEGRAQVARAEAEQKKLNATLVEQARGKADQAEQDKRAAANEREAAILRAQGDAEAARLKVAAGLSPVERAEFELKKQQAWAQAMAQSAQPLVPSIVMGGGASGANALTGWQAAMEATGAKVLRDMAAEARPQVRPVAATASGARGRGDGPNATR